MTDKPAKSGSSLPAEKLTQKKLIEFLDVTGTATNLNDKEKKQFIEIAQAFNLNPFKREIYCNKYGSNLSIIVGYEVYLKRAEATGVLDGWAVTTDGEGKDLSARITIHRKDRSEPFVHEVDYSEYVGKKSDGTITKFWKQKPKTMLKKVVMSQGFRLCFPIELGGMPYAQEELNDVEPETVDQEAEIVEETPKEKKKPATKSKAKPAAKKEAEIHKPTGEERVKPDSNIPKEYKVDPERPSPDLRSEEEKKADKAKPKANPPKEKPTVAPELATEEELSSFRSILAHEAITDTQRDLMEEKIAEGVSSTQIEKWSVQLISRIEKYEEKLQAA